MYFFQIFSLGKTFLKLVHFLLDITHFSFVVWSFKVTCAYFNWKFGFWTSYRSEEPLRFLDLWTSWKSYNSWLQPVYLPLRNESFLLASVGELFPNSSGSFFDFGLKNFDSLGDLSHTFLAQESLSHQTNKTRRRPPRTCTICGLQVTGQRSSLVYHANSK